MPIEKDAFETFVADVQAAWAIPEHRWLHERFMAIRGNLMDRPMLRTNIAGITATMLAGAFWAIDALRHSPAQMLEARRVEAETDWASHYEAMLATLAAQNQILKDRIADYKIRVRERSFVFFLCGLMVGVFIAAILSGAAR